MITLIGSGNVASWIAQRLKQSKEFPVTQVYSRNLEHARQLADAIGAEAVNDIQNVRRDSFAYIFAIKDDAFGEILPQLPFRMPLALHTAGSVSQHVFAEYAEQFGVLYPLQTFSKDFELDKLSVPLCLELDHVAENDRERVLRLTSQLSDLQYDVNEAQRARMHLAAVFACNFSNALYGAAEEVLHGSNLPFEMLIPLLEQTVNKVKTVSPKEAQTGPAKRNDLSVIQKHLDMLDDSQLSRIYEVMTDYIRRK